MSLDSLFVLCVLLLFALGLLSGKVPVDLGALTVLILFTIAGYLTPSQAFTGFSSPAVVTLFSMFFMSAAFVQTGLSDFISRQIIKLAGNSEQKNLCIIMALAGLFSAFMVNVAVTLILMPTAVRIAKRTRISPGKLLLPLSFAALLGGTLTSVGTTPNILLSDFVSSSGLGHLHLLQFTPIGAALLLGGIIYLAIFGRRHLPNADEFGAEDADFMQVYKMEERLFSIRVPKDSSLNGRTLGDLRFGSDLRVGVVTIIRGPDKVMAPSAKDVVKANDLLIVRGSYDDLIFQLKLQELSFQAQPHGVLNKAHSPFFSAHLTVTSNSTLVGKSLREARFRKETGMMVLQIERGGQTLKGELAALPLLAGDRMLVLGPPLSLSSYQETGDVEIQDLPGVDAWNLEQKLFLAEVPSGSVLEGLTIRDSRLGEMLGLVTLGIIRNDELLLACSPEEVLQSNDKLLILGEPARLERLHQFTELQAAPDVPEEFLLADDLHLFEVAISPRSSAVDRTVHELHFREKFGLQVLAIWRAGLSIRTGLRYEALKFGDALLLQGPPSKMRNIAGDSDWIVLSDIQYAAPRSSKAPIAAGIFLGFAALTISGMAIQLAAALAAVLLVLFGTVTMEEVYKTVEWRILVFIGCLVPNGIVLVKSGAAATLATWIQTISAPLGAHGALVAFLVLSSLISQMLDGTLSVVVLSPVCVAIARSLGVDPMPLLMGTAFAASIAFLFPFSHRSHLLVMGAGGYKSSHYWKTGVPLTAISLVILLLLLPVFFPF